VYIKNNFEIDHNIKSSKYHYFCTTFYNLYPACSNCNRSKLAEEVKFKLFTEDKNEIDAFEFGLAEHSVIQYWTDLDVSKVELTFESIHKDQDLIDNHNKYFKVNKLYAQQIDLIEELLQKSMAYNEASRQGLVSSFKSIFPDETLIKRLLISNYTDAKDIHKRPMAKFTQDIAKQLGLL
jgi:hypothetical protein